MRPKMNLAVLNVDVDSDSECRAALEELRWPKGVTCLRCGSAKISRISTRRQYDCDSCRYRFSVTTGTILHDSHLPLTKWFLAVLLMCEAKKGISANQMKRTLGTAHKTAWYLCHRIRQAMSDVKPRRLTGIVEADETYIGGAVGLHQTVNYSAKEYVRGIIGSFHQISRKHLDRYLDEFEFRYNNRGNPYLFRDTLTRLVKTEAMPYEQLTA